MRVNQIAIGGRGARLAFPLLNTARTPLHDGIMRGDFAALVHFSLGAGSFAFVITVRVAWKRSST